MVDLACLWSHDQPWQNSGVLVGAFSVCVRCVGDVLVFNVQGLGCLVLVWCLLSRVWIGLVFTEQGLGGLMLVWCLLSRAWVDWCWFGGYSAGFGLLGVWCSLDRVVGWCLLCRVKLRFVWWNDWQETNCRRSGLGAGV